MSTQFDTDVLTRTQTKLKKPSMYNVVFHNDNKTTMDFVVYVLVEIFNHTIASANNIMIHVHKHGKGIAGTYNLEIAEQKQNEVMELAKLNNFPLKVTVEQV